MLFLDDLKRITVKGKLWFNFMATEKHSNRNKAIVKAMALKQRDVGSDGSPSHGAFGVAPFFSVGDQIVRQHADWCQSVCRWLVPGGRSI